MVQFKDLNEEKPAFQKAYANQIKRCDEMSRQIRYLYDELDRAGVVIAPRATARAPSDMDRLEARLGELERELGQMGSNNERLDRSYNELVELQLVLEQAGAIFRESAAAAARETTSAVAAEQAAGIEDPGAPLLEAAAPPPDAGASSKGVQLGHVSGTIPANKLESLERLLFRATRGNVLLRSTPAGSVADPATGRKVEKAVFVAFFAGDRARVKIGKIADACGANRYPYPDDPARARALAADVHARLRELSTTLEAGSRLRAAALSAAAADVATWAHDVRRETGVCATLNKLSVDASRKVLVGEAWVPVAARARVSEALRRAAAAADASTGTVFQPVVTYEPPPTLFATGKVTQAFQDIVDAYGVARYREVNPGVFTIVTFPFLFAVMFGDLGHGILLLAFAAYLILNEKKLGAKPLGDIMSMMFGGRYVILLMALFSMYTGTIYNEFFSMATTLFGPSHFQCATNGTVTDPVAMAADPALCPSAFDGGLAMAKPGAPYAFGVDPAWKGTRTELPYLNSVKMKLSIVLGVAQMDLGIFLSYLNQRNFEDTLSTVCEFIPQMVFLNAMFGYLSFLIVAKWATGGVADLYHTLIYMFLSPGNVDCDGACPENKMFKGQGPFQVALLLASVISVPIMLLPKPLILKHRAEKRARRAARAAGSYGRLSDDPEDPMGGLSIAPGAPDGESHSLLVRPDSEARLQAASIPHGADEEVFEFGEVLVHQMIHTIEFVLGAVSNTASYLRLWALSLAHAQLSSVFYDRVLMNAIRSGSPVALFIGFFVFAFATLGVLMGMESLSAFLHALRLHWVEFNNKFFHGDGYAFAPFAFKTIDEEDI